MKKVYAIDLDGVLFDFKSGLGLYIEDKIGIPYKEDDIVNYYWHECIDELSKEDFFKCFHDFGMNGGYRDLDALPGAIEGVKKLVKDGHRVRLITNRPAYSYKDTVESLVIHGLINDKTTSLHFVEGSKSPHMRKFNVDVAIDDSPYIIPDIATNTRAQIYCMDHSFNRHLDDNNGGWFKRVFSFNEFLEMERASARI